MTELIKKTKTIEKNTSKIILDLFYKNPSEIWDWSLYINSNLILTYKKLIPYINLWKEGLDLILNHSRVFRVLIVGGANQFLSNYVLKFPSDITIVDPLCYEFFKEGFLQVLNLREFVNFIDPRDSKQRKLLLIDMDLQEAYEDGCFKKEEFDLILVDNFIDNLYHKTGMYSKEIPSIYFDLLKNKGFLMINQKFSIKKITTKSLLEYPSETIKLIKQNNKYYSQYLLNLNKLLCETDFIGKQNQRLSVYSKVYTGNPSD